MTHSSTTAIIEDLSGRIDDWLDATSREPAVKASALRALREIGDEGEDLDMLLSESARKDFIVDYLGAEKVRLNADTPADLPEWVDADSVRSEPLCTCNFDCAVKQARLSREVTDAESLDAGIRTLKQTHSGHPAALVEANDAYRRKLSNARVQLQTVLAALSSNTTVEDLRDAAPDEPAENDDTGADEAPVDA